MANNEENDMSIERLYDPSLTDTHPQRRPVFNEPWAPARAAVAALAPARRPGYAATDAAVLVAHLLSTVDQLTAAGQPLSAAQSDELRALIDRAVDMIVPLDSPDADTRRVHAERRVWVEEAFRLLCGHLEGV